MVLVIRGAPLCTYLGVDVIFCDTKRPACGDSGDAVEIVCDPEDSTLELSLKKTFIRAESR
jgi:hypothetical protein